MILDWCAEETVVSKMINTLLKNTEDPLALTYIKLVLMDLKRVVTNFCE